MSRDGVSSTNVPCLLAVGLFAVATTLAVLPARAQSGASATAVPAASGEAPPDDADRDPPADDPEPITPWRVAVAGSPPFVIRDGEQLTGLAIDVWTVVAERAALHYDLVAAPDVESALEGLRTGRYDAAVGPLSITAARARDVSFTQPYFQSRLAIASLERDSSVADRLAPFATITFLGAVLSVLVVLGLVGVLLWFAERKDNEQFPREPVAGIGNGLWLALVTMTTVGYGDRAPVTVAGKVICGVWMVVAVLTATSLLAGIASALTVSQLDRGHIEVADDLLGAKVATVSGGPAAGLARAHGAEIVHVDGLSTALERLGRRDVDAVVFDEPQLRHHAAAGPPVVVSDATYHPQGYGFALPVDSERTHDLNVALLHAAERGVIDGIRARWLPGMD